MRDGPRLSANHSRLPHTRVIHTSDAARHAVVPSDLVSFRFRTEPAASAGPERKIDWRLRAVNSRRTAGRQRFSRRVAGRRRVAVSEERVTGSRDGERREHALLVVRRQVAHQHVRPRVEVHVERRVRAGRDVLRPRRRGRSDLRGSVRSRPATRRARRRCAGRRTRARSVRRSSMPNVIAPGGERAGRRRQREVLQRDDHVAGRSPPTLNHRMR